MNTRHTHRLRSLFLATLTAILATAIAPPAGAANASYYEALLRGHGVDTSPAGLAAFLENGWRAANPPATMPPEPALKSSLLIDAWQLLARRYDDFLAAPPDTRAAISAIALRYAQNRFPTGAVGLVEEDLRGVDPGSRNEERDRRLEVLQFNGVIASGWFGEPTESNRAVLRRLLERETRPLIRVHYMSALALLGDADVVDELVAEASKANRGSSVTAAGFLSMLTGRTFDLSANRAVEPRAEAAQEIIRWRMKNPGPIQIDRTAVVDRQMRPPRATTATPNLHTLRGLLRASADKLDVADKRGSRTAWNQLDRMGPSLLKHIEPVVDDAREDLDIRAEAIRWYVRLAGKHARRRLKHLTDDPNPEIQQLAKKYLKDRPWEN